MDIRDRLEAALDFLLCDADELTEDVEAKGKAARKASDTSKGRGKKRKRDAKITDEDFNKRLDKLVQASRVGGSMPRGAQYRQLHTPPPQTGNVPVLVSSTRLCTLEYGEIVKPMWSFCAVKHHRN